MATLGNNVFAAHVRITLGVLRNGSPADVVRTARESSLAPKYHFSGVRYADALNGDPTAFAPACPSPVLLEAQVRAAFSTIVEADVASAQASHDAANGVFDAAASRTSSAANPANRLEAIALGSVATALVFCYKLAEVDLVDTESLPAKLAVVAPVSATGRAGYAALLATISAGWTVTLASGHDRAAATAEELVMLDMPALSAVEVDLAYAMMSMGQVAPVRAGAQLFIDGHHYLSDPNASARHRAIEREVLGRCGTECVNVWRANTMLLRNCVWHAACHSVKADVLQGFAEDADMPARLEATGYGSMSIGLPAQEDLFNRAHSYLAVYTHVHQTAAAHDHTITLDRLRGTVQALQSIPRRSALTGIRPALPGIPAGPWPPGCNTRAKALKLYLEPALADAEPVAAWMFGFFREICSRAGIRSNSPEGSLLRSYSLKRAVGNFLGESNRAQEMFAARARFVRAQAEEGHLEKYVGHA